MAEFLADEGVDCELRCSNGVCYIQFDGFVVRGCIAVSTPL